MLGEFNIIWLLLAFCGGVFGAAVGALPSFIFTGFGAVLGAAVAIAAGVGSQSELVDAWITWGPFVGPQCAFAGGVAATVYAKQQGLVENGRDITKALIGLNDYRVLVVGGCFGVLGALATWLFSILPAVGGYESNNAIATAIVVVSILARVCFGDTGVFGKPTEGYNRWVSTDKGCWIPWQSKTSQIMTIALAVGFTQAYFAQQYPQTSLLFFGLGCIVFVFAQDGNTNPVFHHICMVAFVATTATGNIWWGVTAAIWGAFICELGAFAFTSHGDSHIDPPTVSIATLGIIQPLLMAAGIMTVIDFSNHPLVADAASVFALIVSLVGWPLFMAWLRDEPLFSSDIHSAMEK